MVNKMLSLVRSASSWMRRAPDAESSELSGEQSSTAQASAPLQYCHVLTADRDADDNEVAAAWRRLEEQMALVPAGAARLVVDQLDGSPCDTFTTPVSVSTLYVDRYAVTNADYAAFVASGCYRDPDTWPPELLSHTLQFVDSTGQPGPRHWAKGRPPRGEERHPVVGLCWFEADAYARWVGKRLLMPAEWQRAATWSGDGAGAEPRYPWGQAFDPQRANTSQGSRGGTAPVDAYREGTTPNGVYQLVGNVWEWVAATYDLAGHDPSFRLVFTQPLAEVRGGAYDTYLSSQATCQFRTGKPYLHRGPNVGFRCCVDADQLVPPPAPRRRGRADS